ncbi:hypothetical protein H0H93_015622 [Arthromyces matolae]|nr:hypothetical protein H0H93_015622 [Arthromyces matolae]
MNLTTDQLLDVPTSVVTTTVSVVSFSHYSGRLIVYQCATSCNAANSALQACNDDPNCLCSADTVASLLDCEQCMFTKLIEINAKLDFRVGSQAVLSGYASACQLAVNVTLAANQTSLTLPTTWDGPFVAVLPIGGAVVAVTAAAILGASALYILSNL